MKKLSNLFFGFSITILLCPAATASTITDDVTKFDHASTYSTLVLLKKHIFDKKYRIFDEF